MRTSRNCFTRYGVLITVLFGLIALNLVPTARSSSLPSALPFPLAGINNPTHGVAGDEQFISRMQPRMWSPLASTKVFTFASPTLMRGSKAGTWPNEPLATSCNPSTKMRIDGASDDGK